MIKSREKADVHITVRVPKSTAERIAKLSSKHETGRSEIIRQLLEEALKNEEV